MPASRFVASSVGFIGVMMSSPGCLLMSPQYFSPHLCDDGITLKQPFDESASHSATLTATAAPAGRSGQYAASW